MKIKIVSDGTVEGTQVVDVTTGEVLELVVGVRWEVDTVATIARADIRLVDVPIEVIGEVAAVPLKEAHEADPAR